MADPDALRYLRIAQADQDEAWRRYDDSVQIQARDWSVLIQVAASLLEEARRQLS